MTDLLSYISSFALNFIERTGYTGVFILSALESAAIPIPSEVVVPFSGFLAASGRFDFWLVVFTATLANLAGSIILFLVARSGGRWILEHYGKYFFIHKRDIEIGERWFARHGIKAIFIGRMLPVVRTFISLPAGVAGMNFLKFCLYTFFGALPWNLGLTSIGYKAGENWDFLHEYFRKADIFIIVLLVVGIVWYLARHKHKRSISNF